MTLYSERDIINHVFVIEPRAFDVRLVADSLRYSITITFRLPWWCRKRWRAQRVQSYLRNNCPVNILIEVTAR
jgi:hypothetical protein